MSSSFQYVKPEDCEEYRRFCVGHLRQLRQFGRPLPEEIWHYTDAGGLIGILQSGKIWTTQVTCLNDTLEQRYFGDLVHEAVKERRKQNTDPVLEPLLRVADEVLTTTGEERLDEGNATSSNASAQLPGCFDRLLRTRRAFTVAKDDRTGHPTPHNHRESGECRVNTREDNAMARFQGMSDEDKLNDIQILNRALFFENRGVWAYSFAADKLSNTEVGKTVLELGLQNRADHEKHQDMLRRAISEAGGTPVQMEKNYDLSTYIGEGQGNVDSDVNIAKLALALEIGAAVGYVSDAAKLKSPYMIELEAGIACIEAIHAARIRAAFNALGIKIPVVPSALISTSDRDNWVIKVERAA
jgi:hypothetical protein